MAKNNLAYDYHRYDNTAPAKGQEKQPSIRVNKAPEKQGSPAKVILATVAAGALLCCVIYGKVETNRIYNEISTQNANVDMLYSENVRMKSEIDSKLSIKNVEEYAATTLGLQKLDKSQQVEYIQIEDEPVVVIPEEEENIFVRIKKAFEGFVEYIRG